ncbi:MAG: hypothetical protein JST39_04630 [Bacteroidetes bacterium]|nr:hypothetical protein [Bacteroidota bacterium]
MPRQWTLYIVLGLGLLFAGEAFRHPPGVINGAVTGNINPSDAALRAWLFSDRDTLMAQVETSGHFQISQVKPGSYRLLVEAKPPYRNNVREGIVVTEGAPTNIGTIDMQK